MTLIAGRRPSTISLKEWTARRSLRFHRFTTVIVPYQSYRLLAAILQSLICSHPVLIHGTVMTQAHSSGQGRDSGEHQRDGWQYRPQGESTDADESNGAFP